jgi:hypothetical protein
MPNTQICNAEFGGNRTGQTGSLGVGYTIFDIFGNVVFARTTTGVYELASGSGCYAADVTFPDNFNGSILWDCPPVTSSYGYILTTSFATEQYNVQANDPKVSDTWNMVNHMTGSVEALYDQAFGRWQIVGNQMLFYAPDNSTLLATFDLYDDTGAPNQVNVFQRRLVPPVNPNPP